MGLLKRIDYSTDKETAKVYIKKYRLTQVPALLFLDAQGNLLWMAVGELAKEEKPGKIGHFSGPKQTNSEWERRGQWAKGKIGHHRYCGLGDLGCGCPGPRGTDPGAPGGLYHHEQSLRLQRWNV